MSGGRIRTLKPELLEDERVAALSHEAWRLFVSTILLADDYGNLRASHKLLDGAVFWAREIFPGISELLGELCAAGLVDLYEVRGQQYLHLRGWEKHQKIDHPSKPRCPPLSEGQIIDTTCLIEDSRESSETLEKVSRDSRARPGPGPVPGSDQDPSRAEARAGVTDTAVSDARGTRISPDWKPKDETVAWAAEQGVDAMACRQDFVEYWLSIPASKARRANWDLTFRGRVRRLLEEGRAPRLEQAQRSLIETSYIQVIQGKRFRQTLVDGRVVRSEPTEP